MEYIDFLKSKIEIAKDISQTLICSPEEIITLFLDYVRNTIVGGCQIVDTKKADELFDTAVAMIKNIRAKGE